MDQVKTRVPHNKMSKEAFISRANILHNNTYSYHLVNYVNTMTKVNIVCKIHGTFDQTPSMHLSGQKCPQCALIQRSKKRSLGRLVFIQKAITVHKDMYNYSNVAYVNSRTKVAITCNRCGTTFKQNPDDHLQGHGCSNCSKSYLNITKPVNFYILKVEYANEVVYKIGISNKTVKQRYKSDNPNKVISKILLETYFIDSYDAILFEKQVKEYFINHRYLGNVQFFGKTKNTEILNINPLTYVLENLKTCRLITQ